MSLSQEPRPITQPAYLLNFTSLYAPASIDLRPLSPQHLHALPTIHDVYLHSLLDCEALTPPDNEPDPAWLPVPEPEPEPEPSSAIACSCTTSIRARART